MKNCPECFGDIPDGAEVCHSCGNRVVGKPCPDCAELARHAAKKHAGLFWDSVEIQTRGQKANSIGCLPKASGLKVKEILERMKE